MRIFFSRMAGVRQFIGVLAGIIFLFAGAFPLYSQANLGRILGTITDQTGGVIAGATVTVTDVDRGVTRTLATDQAGEYAAPNLQPGTYSVKVEAKGFQTTEHAGLTLEVGKDLRVDLTVQPGEQSQMVTVTGDPPMVDTTNTTLGGTLSNQAINELPLNGRNYQNLLTLRPGVILYPGGGTYTQSSNGSRTEDIGYLIDGLRVDEAYTGQSVLNAPISAGDTSTSLPIDAIQEFNTEENPKAEYGWKPGAIVNAGLKSGTNTIHGSAFAFGRDTGLDARNVFDVAPLPKAPVALEQFGATVGGPVKKDKLFYFAAYEGQRYSVGSTYQTITPETVAGGGVKNSLVDACNSLAKSGSTYLPIGAAGNPISALSARISGISINPATGCQVAPTNFTPGPSESFFPTNNGTGIFGPTTVVLGLISNNQQDNGVVKIDYHPNSKHTFSGMYFHGEGGGIWNDGAYETGIAGTSSSPWMSNLFGNIQVGEGAWTWVPNSSWVNEFRAGYDHFDQNYLSVDHNVNPTAYGINTGVTDPNLFGFPFIRFTTFNVRLGGNWPKLRGPDGSFQLLDHVSVLRGNHAFKFGGEFIYNTAVPFVTANGKGTVRFANKGALSVLQTFLEGTPRTSGSLSQILVGDPLRHYHNEQYAAFFQDDWRIKPRLTLNLGVRYELISVLQDSDNQLGNFLPGVGLVQVGHGESSAYGGDHNNFSPRVGLAWDVRGDGKTVLRAGGSVMYEQLAFNVFDNIANQLGLSQVPTGATIVINGHSTPGIGNMGVLTENVTGSALNFSGSSLVGGTTTVFPASVFALQCGDGSIGPTGLPANQCNTEAIDPNLRTPYVSTWTLNLQQALTNNISLEIAYVGTHGTKLLGFRDINQPVVGACPSESATCEQAARPFNAAFPYLAQIDQLSNLDNSGYNGLQLTLVQRASHGFSYTAGYTYAHSIDEASSNWNANTLPPNSYNPRMMYGNSDFDIRNRFTLGITYAIPGKSGFAQMLQGWELNSRVTLQSALPWSVQDLSDDFAGNGQVTELNSFGQPWNFYGTPSDFNSSRVPLPFFPGSGATNPPAGTETSNSACNTKAESMGAAAMASLASLGCYAKGTSILIPPAAGTLGNTERNMFRDSGFKNWDFSVSKRWVIRERLTTQFRAEFFNFLNHPNFSNPGGPAGAGYNDPSAASFGCGCITPDQAAPNPVLGSGGARSIQLGLKLLF